MLIVNCTLFILIWLTYFFLQHNKITTLGERVTLIAFILIVGIPTLIFPIFFESTSAYIASMFVLLITSLLVAHMPCGE